MNKVHPQDGEVARLLAELLPPAFTAQGYGATEMTRLIEAKHLRLAHAAQANDLALLFRGRRTLEVPQLDIYVPGYGTFLDSLFPREPEPKVRSFTQRGGLDDHFVRRGRTIALEPVEDGIAIGPAPLTLGLGASVRAHFERRGRLRSLALEHVGVEVYQLPRGERASSLVSRLREDRSLRYANHLYRYDPKRPNDLLVLTDRLFVRFDPDMKRAKVREIADKMGLRLAEPIDKMLNGYLAIVKSGVKQTALEIANHLLREKLVVFAEPDWVRALSGRSKPRFSEREQWHLENAGQSRGTTGADAGIARAWRLGARGTGVTVAIIDEGMDIEHPQLDRAGKLSHCFDVGTATPDPRPRYHDEEHGTNVAGLAVAARTEANTRAAAGVAPRARLMAIRATEYLTEAQVYRAFKHARRHHADIVSCSWGPDEGRTVLDDIPEVVAFEIALLATRGRKGHGTPVFFAAGNGNESTDTDGWVSHENVIGVASSDHHDRRVDESDFGQAIWICAPSASSESPDLEKIVTLGPGGAHMLFDGNSAACPIAAGVAALMLSANRDLTALEVKEILKQTADKIDPDGHDFKDREGHLRSSRYDANGHSMAYGHGRINAEKAVLEAMRRKIGSKT